MNSNLFGGFEDEPQIDLTPLIDCLFMLIIFFVLTMSFSKPVLEVVLPQAVNGAAALRLHGRRAVSPGHKGHVCCRQGSHDHGGRRHCFLFDVWCYR